MIRSTDRAPLSICALVAFAALASVASPASAEETRAAPTAENMATARDSLKEGMALRDAGNPAAALPKLHLAYVLVGTPVTGYELGKTYALLGQLLSAREAFISVGRMPRSIEESERSENARRESERLAAELEPHVPKLRIHVTLPPGATATVSVDGVALLTEALVAPRSVNPGTHEVTAKAGDGEPVSTKVEIKADETKDVSLAPHWIQPKPAPTPERPYYIKTTVSPLLYVGVVAGVLGTAGGSTALGLAAQERADGTKLCGARYCPPSSKSNFDAVFRYDVLGTTSFAIAGAGACVSLWAFLKPKTEKVYTGIAPVVGPGSVGVRGTF